MKYPSSQKQISNQRGFTLIELMIVMAIISVLAAIAIPSYRQYIIRNAEAEAQARMQQLDLELEKWRSSALSYNGFQPHRKDGVCSTGNYCFDAGNSEIYIPDGSNASNAKYVITLLDQSGAPLLTDIKNLGNGNLAVGQGWVMVALPLNNYENSANRFYLTSTGSRCKTIEQLEVTEILSNQDCGMSSKEW